MTISTLDDRTLDLLLAGELETADAPAGYARVATLIAVASSPPAPAEQEMPPGLLELMIGTPSVVTPFRRTASAGRSRRFSTRAAMVGAGVLFTATSAAAATNHLPAPLQEAVSGIAAQLGVSIPTPDDEAPDAVVAVVGDDGTVTDRENVEGSDEGTSDPTDTTVGEDEDTTTADTVPDPTTTTERRVADHSNPGSPATPNPGGPATPNPGSPATPDKGTGGTNPNAATPADPGTGTPAQPANPNAGPGNNAGGGAVNPNANPNAGSNNGGGPGATNPNAGGSGATNPNAGGNNGATNPNANPNAGSTNPNAGSGSTNPNAGSGSTNPNAGSGSTNPNAGPGSNNGGGQGGRPSAVSSPAPTDAA